MTEQTANKRTYKKTLNLPKTSFSMKANLVQREPEFEKRWERLNLYSRFREATEGRPRFLLHDGPPYANGPIHLGHLLNKVLKDLVVRSKTMAGYSVPFTPGWDCHGLPIEHKVLKEVAGRDEEEAGGEGAVRTGMSAMEIRRRCRETAERFVDVQARQMLRLGTIGDYANPYLTMVPAYEARVLEVFASLVDKGLVYRDLKPVHWSIANQTALADAELEYADREDRSVHVHFEVENPDRLPAALQPPSGEPATLLIWTTTPWTLPGNLAVAVGPDIEYGLYRYERDGKTCHTLIAEDLHKKAFDKVGLGENHGHKRLGLCRGRDLVEAGLRYRHPFVDRTSPLVLADYVSTEEGTGLVHTAPGHGAEDYTTGVREGLAIYSPVRADGTFDPDDASLPRWLADVDVWTANERITERLRETGHLFHEEAYTHSYPHDWRSKTPVIFRATEQWFVSLDKPVSGEKTLRELALHATDASITFHPPSGRHRLRGMLESRPGLPIPALFDEEGRSLLTPASVRTVAEHIRERGSDAWFEATPAELLAGYDPSADRDAPEWLRADPTRLQRLSKGEDIFDVWFESGSSWDAVLRRRGLGFPADLYLEGSDQHRGWFQLSLLPALGTMGEAPYKAMLTHGFMVDPEGRKMSKSLGNVIEVEDLLKTHGADVCRWWVSSVNTNQDAKVAWSIFSEMGDSYRKVRNTVRFCLGNLHDFDPTAHARPLTEADATTLDAWAMQTLGRLTRTVVDAYERFDYRRAHEAIFDFCNHTLSAVYLAAVKDRLYCDPADADRRRRTQTTLRTVADHLVRLVAPILVHTADEAWLALHGRSMEDDASVHLEPFPTPPETPADEGWDALMAHRDEALRQVERFRQDHDIDNPLDIGARLSVPAEPGPADRLVGRVDPVDWADLLAISRVELERSSGGVAWELFDLRDEPRCERSWKRDGTVRPRDDGGTLSARDAEAVGVR